MEDEGMNITVVGATLIVAAVIGVVLLARYLLGRLEQAMARREGTQLR